MAKIYVSDVVVDETSEFADFRIWLDETATVPITVKYATVNWTANSTGNQDYVAQSGTLNFQPGETEQTVRVAIRNNTTAESIERFKLDLSAPTNAVIEKATGWATIHDNDAGAGTPMVWVDDLVVDEASGAAVFTVRFDRPSTGTVTLNYATRDGSALAGQDYTATTGSLTFTQGQVVKTVSVPLLNDTAQEGNESFSLLLSGLNGVTSFGEHSGTATIWANDAPQATQPRLYVSDLVVDESQRFADVTVYLDAPGTNAVTVDYATANWTANSTGGQDYITQSGTLSFQPGETVKTVRIDIANNTTAENTERFQLNLSNPTNAVLEKAKGWVTIYDNDAAAGMPTVWIESQSVEVNESDREAVFTVRLDRPATGAVELDFKTLDGTAMAGSDFAATTGHLVFAPGQVVQTVRVPLIDDAVTEAAENFSLALYNLSGASTRTPVLVATIAANDGAPLTQPSISVADASVQEGEKFLDFVVTLSAPATNAVTVGYATANGTANSIGGQDYTTQSGTLSFQPGETVKTVRIDISNNTSAESTEQFTLKLTNPLNAVLTRATATATIYDDDGAKQLPSTAADDVYEISDPSTRPTEAAGGGTDTVRSWVNYTLPDHVESLELLGAADLDGFGNTGNNALTGNAGHNTLVGLWGNDSIDGGAGVDTVLYTGRLAEYAITWNAVGQLFTIADQQASRDGTDTVRNVENFVFADGAFTLAEGIARYGTGEQPEEPEEPGQTTGTPGNDLLQGTPGNDRIDGLDGIDRVLTNGSRAEHNLTHNSDGSWQLASTAGGSDQLVNVERVLFSDGAVALDLNGNAGAAARLLGLLSSPALHDPGVTGVVLGLVDSLGLEGAARVAVDSGVVAQLVGGGSQQQLLGYLYTQLIGQAPGQPELQALVTLAQGLNLDNAQVLATIASMDLTAAHVGLVGLAQQGLAFTEFLG